MGATVSLLSNDRRAAMRVAIHEALPVNLYPLEERSFSKGSFYNGDESFADHRAHVPVFETLGLHEWSVSQLWRHFRLMNETGSGQATLWEFREYFDLPDDRSTTRLFRCFDEDRDNRVGFLELVVGLWSYCCNCNASLMCFAFDLYDTDHNGQISLEEADFMIEDVFGQQWESNDLAKITHDWVHRREDAVFGKPELGIEDWAAFMSVNHLVLAEASRTRLVLQNKVIGVDFWSHCLTKRTTIYSKRRATVEQLLGAHISREVLESLANDRNPMVDHDDATQFTLKVLRRTGPFPRRRKYRDLKGKKLTIKTGAQFKTLLVKEAFERLTVPPGKDALWEEPKSPSALQALMASLTSLQERCPTDRVSAAKNPEGDLQEAEKQMKEQVAKHSKSKSSRARSANASPEALDLLTIRPGRDGTPLGSPVAAAENHEKAGVGDGGGGDDFDDPIIANAFHGLKPMSPEEATPTKKGKRKLQKGSPRRNDMSSPSPTRYGRAGGSPTAASGGKETLTRTGRELVVAGKIRPVGRGGLGDGVGGQGVLSARLLVGAEARRTREPEAGKTRPET